MRESVEGLEVEGVRCKGCYQLFLEEDLKKGICGDCNEKGGGDGAKEKG